MRIVTVARDVVGGDDVDAADVGEQPQHVVDVGVLEVEVDAAPGVAAGLGGHGRHERARLARSAACLGRPRRRCAAHDGFAAAVPSVSTVGIPAMPGSRPTCASCAPRRHRGRCRSRWRAIRSAREGPDQRVALRDGARHDVARAFRLEDDLVAVLEGGDGA